MNDNEEIIFSKEEDAELFDIVRKLISLNKASFDPSDPQKNSKSRQESILQQIENLKL